ncbi:MAG: hypothetical protein PVG13_08990 [Thiohalophilus sp.]|jgi:hypothetical protein
MKRFRTDFNKESRSTGSQKMEENRQPLAGQPRRERRNSSERRQTDITSYLKLTGGIDRRRGYGRRIKDTPSHSSFISEFL